MSIAQAFGDAQTTIACLAGGIGGAASDALASYVVYKFATPVAGIGSVGLEFCFRAVVSAGVFGALHAYMPETSSNIFFSILYFAADKGLMMSALGLSRATVGAATGTLRATSAPTKRAVPAGSSSCSTSSCNSDKM